MSKRVPYMTNEEIWLQVEAFKIYCDGIDPITTIPVDAIYVAEIALGLNIVPIPHFFDKYHQDAALTNDLKDLLVDEKAYAGFENGLPWIENRLRFSVAHELGHYWLHSESVEDKVFRSLDGFKFWLGDRSKSTTLEYQADEFAGRLLVPRENLIDWYDRYRTRLAESDPEWWKNYSIRQRLAEKIAPRFGVNSQVIEIRFDKEGLWPTE